MPNVDTTLTGRAEAADMSLVTYTETRGHLLRGVRQSKTAQSNTRSHYFEGLVVDPVDCPAIQLERAQSGRPVVPAIKRADLDE